MKKIPLDMITALANFDQYSPVYWDGYNLVVSTNKDINLNEISLKLNDYKDRIDILDSNSNEVLTKMAILEPQFVNQKDILDKLLVTFTTVLNDVDSAYSRLPTLEERVANAETDIENLGSTFNSVSSGVNILSDLASGNYFVGSNGIKVERITDSSTSGIFRISYIGNNGGQSSNISSNSDIIDIGYDVQGNTIIDFDVHALHQRFEDFGNIQTLVNSNGNITIKALPGLIIGDNSTIEVKFDDLSGVFTISAVSAGSGSSGSNTSTGSNITLDNDTLVTENGKAKVSLDVVNANIYNYTYVTSNYGSSTPSSTLRFIEANDGTDPATISNSVYSKFPVDQLGTEAKILSSNDLSFKLKSLVFASANAGKFKLFANTNVASTTSELKNQTYQINSKASKKSVVIDYDFEIMLDSTNPANKLSTIDFAGITPFYLCWLTNNTVSKTSVHFGDILSDATRSLDDMTAKFKTSGKIYIPNNDLLAKKLDEGSFTIKSIIGFKVISSAEISFNSMINTYVMEPKFNVMVTYL